MQTGTNIAVFKHKQEGKKIFLTDLLKKQSIIFVFINSKDLICLYKKTNNY